MSVPTPHISASINDFAKTVLMPGDPLRAKMIAEKYLENTILVNEVRGALGYTGTYKGIPVSVMTSGMGVPSMGIYSYELYNFYNVENIIRIGSAGGLASSIELYDVVAAIGACTNSNYAAQFGLNGTFAPTASFDILCRFVESCKKLNIEPHIGNVLTSDSFYSSEKDCNKKWADMGVLAVEMETAALYINAAKAGKNALAVFTISDCPDKGTEISSEARQNFFGDMIKAALETAIML